MACGSGSEQEQCCPPEPVIVPNWQGNLQTLQKGFDGTMTVLLAPMATCPIVFGAAARAIPYIGITFSVYRGVVSGIIGYHGDPTPDEQVRLQHSIFSGTLALTGVVILAMAGAATIPVSLAFAGAGGLYFLFLDQFGNTIYDWVEDNLNSLLSVGKYDPRHAHLYHMGCLKKDLCGPRPPSPRRDPLVLDLNGDGIKTAGLNRAVHFDHDGNGFAERTGWVESNDGLLVMDRNGNGIIDNGRELFSDQTILRSGKKASNGFEALADLDDNHDGKIDVNDAAFSQLRAWKDSNEDGYSQPDELHGLDGLDIKSINLDSTITNITDDLGNTQSRVGAFEYADGTIGQIAEYSFEHDTIDSVPTKLLDIPEDILALPNLVGSGNVYDLQQAMVRDTSGQLKSLVEQFANAADPAARNVLMGQILFKWTGTEGISPGSRYSNYDARTLTMLERFFGESLFGPSAASSMYSASTVTTQSTPNTSANLMAASSSVVESRPALPYETVIALNDAYRKIFELDYAELMSQTHLKDLYSQVTYTWDMEKQEVVGDYSGVIAELQTQLANDPEQGKELLGEFSRSMRGLGHDRASCLPCREIFLEMDPSLGWVIDSGGLPVYEHLHQGLRAWSPHIEGTDNADAIRGSLTEGDGYLNGLNGDDVIYGTERNEILINETGDALLVAGGGNDQIWAGAGNDILDGGTGNDTLLGEAGNDTYIFRRGSGQDTIIDPDSTLNNVDTIWLGGNLAPDDISLKRAGNNLVLKINDTTDTLTVKDFFRDGILNRVEQIQFMDGTVWTDSDMIRMAYSPTEGDDIIYGGIAIDDLSGLGGNDTVYGLTGDDTLHGDAGDDHLYGQPGNDQLYGEAGNDTLTGEEGNDTLVGGSGDDVLEGGPGNDTLYGSDWYYWHYSYWHGSATANGNDTYLFGRGSGQDTIFGQTSTTANMDTIALGEGVLPADINLERIEDDLKLTISDTQDSITVKDWAKADTPGYGVEVISFADGTTWDLNTIKEMSLQGTSGDDTLVAYVTADTLQGYEGNDTLYGHGGDDTLDGGGNDDTIDLLELAA